MNSPAYYRLPNSLPNLRDYCITTVNTFLTIGHQDTKGCFLILPHEAAVAFDIGAENGSELAFYTRLQERLSYRPFEFVKRVASDIRGGK